jgi:hypothetical protein
MDAFMSNTFQILDDQNNVINTIIASIDFVQEFYPGHYREIPDSIALSWVITKVAMISRFTPQEYLGIINAAKIDAEVQAWYDLFQASTRINLEDKRTISGINSLVSKELLTQERSYEILSTSAQPNEVPI